MAARKQTVVSVTPIALERDSRTLKQAFSLSRFGYRSIVVEGEASGRLGELPFELITIEGALPVASGAVDAVAGAPDEPAPIPEPEREEPSPPSGWIGRLRLRFGLFRWRLRAPTEPFRWYANWNDRAYRALPDADLYMIHSYPLAAAVLRRCLGRRRRRFTYDAHDAYFELRPEQLEGLGRGERAWAAIERLAVRRASGFTTVGEGVAGLLEERYRRRPLVIRNCHDRRLERPSGETVRGLTGASATDFVCVAVGNDKEGMTLPAAIEALAQLPERFRLVYVGRGHERHRDLVERLGLEGRAHHLEAVPAPEVVPLIRDAEAALVPYRPLTGNYANALPNGFFQALGAGLPLLYPDSLGEVAATVRRHDAGIAVDSTDPASVATALRSLGEDSEELSRLRANATAAGEAESWEREEEILRRFVAGALGDREAARDATLSGRPRPGELTRRVGGTPREKGSTHR